MVLETWCEREKKLDHCRTVAWKCSFLWYRQYHFWIFSVTNLKLIKSVTLSPIPTNIVGQNSYENTQGLNILKAKPYFYSYIVFQLHKSSCFNSDHRMSETFMSFFMLSMMMQSLICFSKQYSYINYSSDTSCCVRVKNMFSFFGALPEKVYISNCILEADFITSAASYNSFSYHMSYLNSAIRMVNGTPMMF